MPGLTRVAASFLRPSVDIAAPSLPRRVLRHLIFSAGLGVGSRVVVGGNEAGRTAALFTQLGIEAETAGVSRLADGTFDAAVWLETETAPAGERSLVSAEALGQTARLLAAVRPAGSFVFVARVGGTAGGHESACLGRHLAAFPGTVEATFFGDRSPGGWFRVARSGYAVATWRSPAGAVEAGLWRRRATRVGSGACCEWAAIGAGARKAA